MKSRPIWLALALLISCIVITSSEVAIDYSHNVKGTGTIITDYQMGDKKSTEASGKVRGTGDVMDKYLFQKSNDSGNITIEDEFVMSKRKPAAAGRPVIASYPQIQSVPDFKFTGAVWADKIRLPIPGGPSSSGISNGTSLPSDLRESNFTEELNAVNLTVSRVPEINASQIFSMNQGQDSGQELNLLNNSEPKIYS